MERLKPASSGPIFVPNVSGPQPLTDDASSRWMERFLMGFVSSGGLVAKAGSFARFGGHDIGGCVKTRMTCERSYGNEAKLDRTRR